MNDGKIIIDKIIADAEEAVNKTIVEAKAAADEILKGYEDKAAKETARSNKLVADEKQRVTEKQLSSAEMNSKMLALSEKQKLLEEVIEEAEKRLSDLPDEEYASVIGSMLSSMDKKLGTEVIVSEKDKTRLADVISKNGFTLSDRTADIEGGLIIRNGDIEYNYSFNSIISIEKEEIQQLAAKILFD